MGVLSAILKFVPFLLSTITSVEGLFVKGTDKKQAVLNSANGILGVLQATGIVTPEMASKFPQATSNLIDAVVAFLNAVGAFPPSAPTV